MQKRWLRNIVFLGLFLLVLEPTLRFVGFGSIPIYYRSAHYEYALVPGQKLYRFGNYFAINEEGMRSDPLSSGETRILKIGDSILNGGVATDQEDLASSILERNLKAVESRVRVLNVSAGSWGPPNAFQWLKQHGTYDAKVLVPVFSSHDYNDRMSFKDVVGNVPFYPEEEPKLAIVDAFNWFFGRYVGTVNWNGLPEMPIAEGIDTDSNGWDQILNLADSLSLPLLVYHHTSLPEVKSGEFNPSGKALKAYLDSAGIATVNGFEAGFSPDDFRDELHPNERGQRKIAEALAPLISEILLNR